MIEIATQLTQNKTLIPFSQEDKDLLGNYHPNQILKAKISGVQKERSIRQMGTYFACCNYVSDNIREDDPERLEWDSKEKVDKKIRMALHFVDDSLTLTHNGTTIFHYRSIAFKNLKHIEACGYFKEAIPLLAMRIGLDEMTLVSNVKQTMGA